MNAIESMKTRTETTKSATPRRWTRALRVRMFRGLVPSSDRRSPGLVVKLAETAEERSAAFRLLHDEYVRSGLTDTEASGMRITPYHALSTTRVIIALRGETVVGTLSLIQRSAAGVPSERIFDLSSIRAKGGTIEEPSSLAVDRSASRDGEILFSLIKFAVQCSRSRFVKHWVWTCHPRHRHLYEEILGFEPLAEREVRSYAFVKGAPAIGAYLDLENMPATLANRYGVETPRTPYAWIFGDDENVRERAA